jgi:hypothetical protein
MPSQTAIEPRSAYPKTPFARLVPFKFSDLPKPSTRFQASDRALGYRQSTVDIEVDKHPLVRAAVLQGGALVTAIDVRLLLLSDVVTVRCRPLLPSDVSHCYVDHRSRTPVAALFSWPYGPHSVFILNFAGALNGGLYCSRFAFSTKT